MAATLSRINPVVSTPLPFNPTLAAPQIRSIPAPVLNTPPTIPSAKFSLPSWTKTAKDFLPDNTRSESISPIHYGSAVLIGIGLLVVGLSLYEYLNSQGKRPDAPERLAPLPLTDYLLVEPNPH